MIIRYYSRDELSPTTKRLIVSALSDCRATAGATFEIHRLNGVDEDIGFGHGSVEVVDGDVDPFVVIDAINSVLA